MSTAKVTRAEAVALRSWGRAFFGGYAVRCTYELSTPSVLTVKVLARDSSKYSEHEEVGTMYAWLEEGRVTHVKTLESPDWSKL
jgi:hypothetical protein